MSYQKVELAIGALLDLFLLSEEKPDLLVAFSGGMDSTVLLHALVNHTKSSSITLRAVHVNHGLQDEADRFEHFCQITCQKWGVPFEAVSVSVEDTARKGLEAAAREKRYASLIDKAGENSVVLTAHHQRDQAETMLLALARGSGVAGLAAMPQQKLLVNERASIWHHRPLLDVPYEALQDYAAHYQLEWIDDPSNTQLHYKRNYIRHQILPKMHQAWLFFNENAAKSAQNLAESLALQNDLAELDLAKCEFNDLRLDVSALQELSWARQKNAIRFWVSCLPKPFRLNGKVYEWLQKSLFHSALDSHPKCQLSETSFLRLNRNKLYYFTDFKEEYCVVLSEFEASQFGFEDVEWMTHKVEKSWLTASHKQVVRNISPADFQNADEARRFKKWLKQQSVVAWNRPRWPVLVIDGDVAAILGFSTVNKFQLPSSTT